MTKHLKSSETTIPVESKYILLNPTEKNNFIINEIGNNSLTNKIFQICGVSSRTISQSSLFMNKDGNIYILDKGKYINLTQAIFEHLEVTTDPTKKEQKRNKKRKIPLKVRILERSGKEYFHENPIDYEDKES